MFTPQQIEQISFNRATFGGYNIDDVDNFLEPLTEYYVTLDKENALLKSKMRVLVEKLEEYRSNEASMKDAIVNAQKTCDLMVKEAQAKCTTMLSQANLAAAQNTKNADSLIVAEEARVEAAKQTAAKKIDEIQSQIRSCLHALDRIKAANPPMPQPAPAPFDYDKTSSAPSRMDAVADEISQSLEALVGASEEPAKASSPMTDATSKFNNLRFGRNYDSADQREKEPAEN